jgi:hypothetical protein
MRGRLAFVANQGRHAANVAVGVYHGGDVAHCLAALRKAGAAAMKPKAWVAVLGKLAMLPELPDGPHPWRWPAGRF